MPQPMRRDPRTLIFVIFSIVLASAAFGYVMWSRSKTAPAPPPVAGDRPPLNDRTLASLQNAPHVLFRNTDLGTAHGQVFVASAGEQHTAKYPTPLVCERVDFSADRGVCLIAERGLTTRYRAATFGRTFEELHQIPLPGIPSRVRVSPSGRRAGITVFVSGDSYAAGAFSTRAMILDTSSGEVIGDLEQYAVTREGQPFKAIDFNFWGITFADDRRFYATLQTGGRRYLIEGDVSARTARVVDTDIECPSLSPDGTRVAFKKREMIDGRLVWLLSVQDLATRTVTVLREERSVDDQPEWLDNNRIVYGLPSESRPGSTSVWAVPADGSGAPALFLDSAWSPAVVGAAGSSAAG
jgi:hypothetical protein